MAIRAPLITDGEKKVFKMILMVKNLEIQDFAKENGYSATFIRGVLINARTSNYARLLIRNYINENKFKVLQAVNAV